MLQEPAVVGGALSQRCAPYGPSTGSAGPSMALPSSISPFAFRLYPLLHALSNRFGDDLALIQVSFQC